MLYVLSLKSRSSRLRDCCPAWLRLLATIVSFVVDALVGDILAFVDQAVYGVVVQLNLFFPCIGVAEGIASLAENSSSAFAISSVEML